MAAYQFFSKPDSDRKEFTYLVMGSDTFLTEKHQLLQLGFEVEDDAIHAKNPQEAVEKFRSNFLYALDEYSNSNFAGGLATFVFETYKDMVRRFDKN